MGAPPKTTEAGLRLQAQPERLVALLRANQLLLSKIKAKRQNLDQLGEKIRVAAVTAMAQLQPVYLEMEQLDQEGHRLFAELLARKRQPRGALRTIKDIYQTMQQLGVLSWRRPDPVKNRAAAESAAPDPDLGWEEDPQRSPGGDGGFSANRPGEAGVGQSLRSLFRKLAEALHPDKVQHEGEKERRTEAMKEITRAYQDGDLARLLELERTWMVGGELALKSDEFDELGRRCTTLARINEGLQAQLDQLTRELKELRRSPQAELLSHLERSAKGSGMTATDWMVEGAKAQLEQLRELVAFVTSFHDGQIDLSVFLEGPSFLRDQEEAEPDLESLLYDLFQPPRRGKKRRGAAVPYPDDCPF